jgi:hypothetical protein
MKIRKGNKAKISPKLTGEQEWLEGEIIDVVHVLLV